MKQIVNEMRLSGIVANTAEVKTFTNSSLARFSLAVSRLETSGEETNRVVAYLQIEMWRRGDSNDSFELLKKGEHITVSCYARPESWVTEDGAKRSRIVWVANKVEPTPEKEVSSEQKTDSRKSK